MLAGQEGVQALAVEDVQDGAWVRYACTRSYGRLVVAVSHLTGASTSDAEEVVRVSDARPGGE